jgi:hypothetical protein
MTGDGGAGFCASGGQHERKVASTRRGRVSRDGNGDLRSDEESRSARRPHTDTAASNAACIVEPCAKSSSPGSPGTKHHGRGHVQQSTRARLSSWRCARALTVRHPRQQASFRLARRRVIVGAVLRGCRACLTLAAGKTKDDLSGCTLLMTGMTLVILHP